MKKLIVLLLALLLAASVGPRLASAAVGETLSGGWTPSESFELTAERQAIFDKGLEDLVGVNYTPVAYLGSQVVAGTNHVFLAEATVVYPGAQPTCVLVYLYEDLQGQVQLMNVADLGILPQADGSLAAPEEGLLGGWAYAESPEVTDEMKARLDKAMEELAGVSCVPVANLGIQVVAGLNRCLLCQLTPVVPDAQPHYALVYVYEDLQGGAELLQTIDLDVGSLCTYGA